MNESSVLEQRIESFVRLLEQGRDDAMLRFSLGSAYFQAEKLEEAIEQLEKAIAHNPNYSAAYKVLGKSFAALDKQTSARDVFEKGIGVAERVGDKQAQKEMQVFLRRLNKNAQ